MIFFIFLALTIGLAVVTFAANNYYDNTDRYGSYNETDEQKAAREKRMSNILFKIAYHTDCLLTAIPAVICGIITAIMLVCIIIGHCGTKAQAAMLIEQQKALEYKISTDYAKDEFGLHNKELIDDVQAWNQKISYNRIAENDFWIGVFYPNIINKYDIHTIELN